MEVCQEDSSQENFEKQREGHEEGKETQPQKLCLVCCDTKIKCLN
jgi:hypothetical protein